MIDLKTSEEWNEIHQHVVMDPDGWDRKNFKWSWYEQRITEDEFNARLSKSTVIDFFLRPKKPITVDMRVTRPRPISNTCEGIYPQLDFRKPL